MALQAGLILAVVFTLLLILSVPISFSIVIASLVTALFILPPDLAVFMASQTLVTGLDSFTLLAVPFFILAGVLMNNGGIAERLVNFAKVLVGRAPGALAHTNVLGNTLFGSLSGSAVAAAAAVGGVLGPLQKKDGYDPRYSAAVNIASAPIGLIVPPSGTLIIYSLVSGGTSVAALFVAGYLPGLLWAIACMVVAYTIAKRRNYPVTERVSLKVAFKTFIETIPSLMLIVIVIGGILAGIFTATEAAAVAVAYTFLLTLAYRTVKIKEFPKVLMEAVELTSIVMMLVAASAVMSWVMAFTGIPGAISGFILGISDNPIVLLLLLNVFLLLIGTFMDITPAVLIFTPIFLPIVTGFGMDPVHFGIMLVMNLSIGTITPPVGNALFVGSSVARLNMEEVTKPLLPFYAVIILVLMLVTYIPAISLMLPNLLLE
ncbi:tripartite ATP-independent transporter DctM subunit [Planomicrobium soli]|uniref:Tripartite ATP-independent transporter DctM subunit n=1 Tax=Planomicrobium soli TaxID=1176648 RepID=A0A2P8H5R2_9BACL|nr:TRAP transporter large permease [Planomicrobium soli]PSL41567.1 tripartite ATP-independent transporter DctM subunit [Planomicrobium soli]